MDHARTIVGSWSNRFFLAEAIGDVFSQILTSGGQAVFFVADAVFGALLESGVRRLRNRGRAVFVKRDGFVAISFCRSFMVFAVVCVLTGAPRTGERFCGSHWIPVVSLCFAS